MIRQQGQPSNAPFSRYKKVAQKTRPIAGGQEQPMPAPVAGGGGMVGIPGRPSPKPGGFVSPELDGMKHNRMDEMSRERGIGKTRPGIEMEGQVGGYGQPSGGGMVGIPGIPLTKEQPGLPQTPEQAPGIGATPVAPGDAGGGGIGIYGHPSGQDNAVGAGEVGGYGEPAGGNEGDIGRGYTNETAPEWGTEDYQQGMYNLAREQISGQTAGETEYARTQLGGRGFRAGESGIANRALMDIQRKGSERLGTESRKMAMQGMGAKYGQQQDLMNMIMQKYGIDVAGQQNRFDPYYQSEIQYQAGA